MEQKGGEAAMQQTMGYLRRAIDDYQMIRPNERIAVALSGGKDSMLMLEALKKLSFYHPAKFSVFALFIDLGFDHINMDALRAHCEKLEVPFIVRKTDIAPLVFETRKESNPCSLCAKMRRACLHDAARENGAETIALGHHRDDAIETFIMNLMFEGRIGCFQPVTYLDRKDVRVIRPMIYLTEHQIKNTVERCGIAPVKNPCPMDHASKRQEVKNLLLRAEEKYPGIREKLFGAIQRSDLDGWKLNNETN